MSQGTNLQPVSQLHVGLEVTQTTQYPTIPSKPSQAPLVTSLFYFVLLCWWAESSQLGAQAWVLQIPEGWELGRGAAVAVIRNLMAKPSAGLRELWTMTGTRATYSKEALYHRETTYWSWISGSWFLNSECSGRFNKFLFGWEDWDPRIFLQAGHRERAADTFLPEEEAGGHTGADTLIWDLKVLLPEETSLLYSNFC